MVGILFLGTGGGRINLLAQRRRTGGFLVLGKSLRIHVDPGPGALFALNECRQNPLSTDALIVTHAHIDHVHDAPLVIEGMTDHMLKKKGILIASRNTIEGEDKSITFYHQSMLSQKCVFSPLDKKTFSVEKNNGGASFSLTGTPVRHDDKSGFGFVLEIEGVRVGYTSDTEYFGGLSQHFQNCDLLIANNIKSGNDPYVGHLDSAKTARLFSECKPNMGIISHLGMKIIESGPEIEAKKIEAMSGVKTSAARDGWLYSTDGGEWSNRSARANAGVKKSGGQKSLFA